MHTSDYAKRVQLRQEHLYRLAYCYVKNQPDALDIVSESVCRGLTRLRQLRDPDRFNAWMDRIVVHTALDHLRRTGRFPAVDEEVLALIPAEEAALTPEEHMDLYQALDLLSPQDRRCISLRFFQGYSFREMGQLLDLPESTIKSRLYRILETLRRQLSG